MCIKLVLRYMDKPVVSRMEMSFEEVRDQYINCTAPATTEKHRKKNMSQVEQFSTLNAFLKLWTLALMHVFVSSVPLVYIVSFTDGGFCHGLCSKRIVMSLLSSHTRGKQSFQFRPMSYLEANNNYAILPLT